MQNAITHIKLKSPVELAAFLITRSTDSSTTQEHLDSVDRMIDNFISMYGLRVAKELRGYVMIRREELKLQERINSNKQKVYDTHNFFRNLGQHRKSSMAEKNCYVSVR